MNWFPLISVSVQVSLAAALSLLASGFLKSAAHRHSVLFAALLCILASPLFYTVAAWSDFAVNVSAVFKTPSESVEAVSLSSVPEPEPLEVPLPPAPETPVDFPQMVIQDPHAPPVETPKSSAVAISESSGTTSRISLRVDFVVVGIWLAGTLFFLAGVLRSQWKTQLIQKAARPAEKDIDPSVLAEAERRLGMAGRLRVATTGKVAGPAVAGLSQSWILIPARYLETLSREELLHVLIHEGAHALRRDPLIALLQRIGGALFWWNPLVHFVNRALILAREEVCDNFVLNQTEPETYGATLLRLATLSPAMARFPAIGMFDGRGKLENRIRRLLDPRRRIMTRVRFITTVMMVGTFALLSLFVAAAHVSAESPEDAASDVPPVAGKGAETFPADSIDAKEFRLILIYHGESDKPFYNLILHVPPQGALQANPFSLAHQIGAPEAGKLIKHLKASQFFEHAKVTKIQDDPTTGPQYLLRVSLGESHFEETLGWDLGTLMRLDGLRKTLDGDAAKSMDQLLARLDGQRKVWESGEVVDDLKTTLSLGHNTFIAGRPIPITLELMNVGQQDRQYGHHHFILSGSEIVVRDEYGRKVPYLGGGAGLKQSQTTIKPGEAKVIESCDLSDYYYLRRPGLYTVAFHAVPVYASSVPPSNAVRFQVIADEGTAADGDPMGKLLPLVSANFGLVGSPNATGKVRPGRNRQETPGWQFIFAGPGGLKGGKASVWLWLTDEAATKTKPPENDYLPESESLGKVSRWHAYLYAPPEALQLWPTVKEDLKAALNQGKQSTSAAEGAASEEAYRLLHDRYRASILAAVRASNKVEIATLTDKFNESIGGKLLFAQVTLRVGPIAEHEAIFTKFFDPQRKVSIGKRHFAVSGKPIVTYDAEQGFVIVATNPLGGNKWPDDLQVTLAIDDRAKAVSQKPPAEPTWSKTKNGLRTRITAEKQTFLAGASIPLKLEMENVGTLLWKYETPVAPHNNALIVLDERGRPVPYLAGLSQVPVHLKPLAPGMREEMKAFDLSESFYLRQPGRYSVRWPGGLVLRGDDEAPIERAESPGTASFEFDIVANPEAASDGDPIGRLLPLAKEKWWLTGTGKTEKVHPGGNREEVPGCFIFFHYVPTGYKPDSGIVSVWLTEKAAAEQPVQAEWPPASEYLGKVDRWHVYTHLDGNAANAWPTAKDDIKKALAGQAR